MSDAVGGVVNVVLIVFFIVAIASYMAFNVNYQKAFNVKNEIVSLYEEYNGRCTTNCKTEIANYEAKLGYKNIKLVSKNAAETCFEQYGYCVEGVEARAKYEKDSAINKSIVHYCYFKIRTQVLVDFPIIDNLMQLSVFQVTGQTRTLKILDNNTSNACVQIGKIG